jgi:hypothetical protein
MDRCASTDYKNQNRTTVQFCRSASLPVSRSAVLHPGSSLEPHGRVLTLNSQPSTLNLWVTALHHLAPNCTILRYLARKKICAPCARPHFEPVTPLPVAVLSLRFQG